MVAGLSRSIRSSATTFRGQGSGHIIGGRSGTLGESAIAYDEGKLIGILQGSGGITERIPELVRSVDKDTGARLVYSPEPFELIARRVEVYAQQHYHRPSGFCMEPVDRQPKGRGAQAKEC